MQDKWDMFINQPLNNEYNANNLPRTYSDSFLIVFLGADLTFIGYKIPGKIK